MDNRKKYKDKINFTKEEELEEQEFGEDDEKELLNILDKHSKVKISCKKYNEDEEKEIVYGDQYSHPYYDEDPLVGKNTFSPSIMLTRGCINIPQSYVPVDKNEMQRNAKLSVHDWMSKIKPPFVENNFDCVEVRFKNSRKEFCVLPDGLEITEGDVVAVEGSPGHDIGIVTLVGELCRVQMHKKKVNPNSETIKKLYRRAKSTDIEKWIESIEKEDKAIFRTRALVNDLNLNMKINDVEFQGDGVKATFYYTAEDRVDFRQLIKLLADEFRIRVEMKQIGVRQEASRLGGIGTCGRELCCSSWLNNFNSVSTQVARVQQIFPNPQKLAGQCGKLKCCLNYEYDVYLDELKSFPEIGVPIFTKKGKANYIKTDVFRRLMWYVYEGSSEFIMLSADTVKTLLKMNRNREPIDNIERYQVKLQPKSKLNI